MNFSNFSNFSNSYQFLKSEEDTLKERLDEIEKQKEDLFDKAYENHVFEVEITEVLRELSKHCEIGFSRYDIEFYTNRRFFNIPKTSYDKPQEIEEEIESQKPTFLFRLNRQGKKTKVFERPFSAKDTLSDGTPIINILIPLHETTNGCYAPGIPMQYYDKITYNFHPNDLLEDEELRQAVVTCVKRKEAQLEKDKEKERK